MAAASPIQGPGGWAAMLRFRGTERELTGAEPATTNNRMELTAAAAALEALTRPCRVVLHTDSEYVRNGITRWHTGWVRKQLAQRRPATRWRTWICGSACWTRQSPTRSNGNGSAATPAM